MANQWFYTRDGKKQFGPILDNQLLKLIEDKKNILNLFYKTPDPDAVDP